MLDLEFSLPFKISNRPNLRSTEFLDEQNKLSSFNTIQGMLLLFYTNIGEVVTDTEPIQTAIPEHQSPGFNQNIVVQ